MNGNSNIDKKICFYKFKLKYRKLKVKFEKKEIKNKILKKGKHIFIMNLIRIPKLSLFFPSMETNYVVGFCKWKKFIFYKWQKYKILRWNIIQKALEKLWVDQREECSARHFSWEKGKDGGISGNEKAKSVNVPYLWSIIWVEQSSDSPEKL